MNNTSSFEFKPMQELFNLISTLKEPYLWKKCGEEEKLFRIEIIRSIHVEYSTPDPSGWELPDEKYDEIYLCFSRVDDGKPRKEFARLIYDYYKDDKSMTVNDLLSRIKVRIPTQEEISNDKNSL